MEDAWPILQAAISKYTAPEIQSLALAHRQAGTICWTADEFQASAHGQANADIGLFELEHHPDPTNQPPAWWPRPTDPDPGSSSVPTRRPLAGLKVVDLTRVIAGPAVSRDGARRAGDARLPELGLLVSSGTMYFE